MQEQFKGHTPPQERLEDLRYQLKRAEEEHAQLLQASQNDPKDSELRVNVDRAYDQIQEIKRQLANLEKPESK